MIPIPRTVATLAEAIGIANRAGGAVLVITSSGRRARLELPAAIRDGSLIVCLDAHRLTIDGWRRPRRA